MKVKKRTVLFVADLPVMKKKTLNSKMFGNLSSLYFLKDYFITSLLYNLWCHTLDLLNISNFLSILVVRQ